MTVDTQKLNLEKGQTANLNQEAGKVLKKVNVAAGWDFNSNSRIDLDLSAIIYNEGGTKIGHAFFNEKNYGNGAVVLDKDNLSGEGDGDDETIAVDFDKLPADAAKILFTITNYTEQPLTVVKNAFARVVDAETGNELARYEVNQFGNHTALFIALLKKTASGFELKAIGEAANGKTFAELVSSASAHLG